MNTIEFEADIINLIGYKTPLKFSFISEGIAEFETVTPTGNFDYRLSFFIDGDNILFYDYSTFNDCLEDYKIFEVKRKHLLKTEWETIWHRKYDE